MYWLVIFLAVNLFVEGLAQDDPRLVNSYSNQLIVDIVKAEINANIVLVSETFDSLVKNLISEAPTIRY